ncbi:MAG: hypothetical protein AAF640_07590, partial [Pseudomonadota bacterium]
MLSRFVRPEPKGLPCLLLSTLLLVPQLSHGADGAAALAAAAERFHAVSIPERAESEYAAALTEYKSMIVSVRR